MTYYVSSGTLNPTHSLTNALMLLAEHTAFHYSSSLNFPLGPWPIEALYGSSIAKFLTDSYFQLEMLAASATGLH